MAPEAPGNLVVLDLELRGSEMTARVERYDPTDKAMEPLRVSWNATESPPGYTSAGRGLVFVRRPPGYEHRTYRATPDVRGDRFSWMEKVLGDPPELMLVIALPPGQVLRSADEANPPPTVSKILNGRMVLYWYMAGEDQRRAEVSWRMEPAEPEQMTDWTAALNEETAARRAEHPILTSRIVDLASNRTASTIASKEEAVWAAPQADSSVTAAKITSRRGLTAAIVAAAITATAVIAAAIINNCRSSSPPPPTPLTGRVIDKSTEQAIRAAKVSLEGDNTPPMAFTDSQGIFSFPVSDRNKELRLRIEATGYENFDLRVIPANSQGIQEIRLTPQTERRAELSGTVRDASNNPLQGAQVTLDDIPGTTPVETSSDGVFRLKEIPRKYGDGVRVRVSKEGYQPYPYTEDVVLGKAPPIIKLTKKK